MNREKTTNFCVYPTVNKFFIIVVVVVVVVVEVITALMLLLGESKE